MKIHTLGKISHKFWCLLIELAFELLHTSHEKQQQHVKSTPNKPSNTVYSVGKILTSLAVSGKEQTVL
jgi:hypothetical protein